VPEHREVKLTKYWTVDEAREYLPRLHQLLLLVSDGLVTGPEPGTWMLPAGAEHAEAALAELESRGVVLRQVDRGLVDFPAIGSDGGLYLLCWHVDEPDIGWWHRPEDGFAGRQQLPLP
jgi:uncharacterized protein DUF2203